MSQIDRENRRDRAIVSLFFVGAALALATLILGPIPMTGLAGIVVLAVVGWLLLRA